MKFSTIIYGKKDFVARIVLNRPEVRNALSFQMIGEIKQALKQAKVDDEVRVVVITGYGDAFSAGRDLKSTETVTPQGAGEYDGLWYTELTNILHLLGKPVIAAVNGVCVGGGCGLAERCDVIIASEKARFGYPEINVGANPAVHMTVLPQLTSRFKAFELIFTGELFSAQEAERLGLVNKVVPHDKLEEEVYQLAQKFASKSPIVFRYLRDAFYRVPGVDYKASLSNTGEIINPILNSLEDSKEGRRAFVEKRPPVWKGK